MSDEVFRGVNKYIDFTTGEEKLHYTKTYSSTGQARSMATRWRNQNKRIGNRYHTEQQTHPNRAYTYNVRVNDTYYEFVETWCERATEWERV